jgi:NAD(P)-dependent dehydrogenase (short-subunit alcohol dehydrogenase family)
MGNHEGRTVIVTGGAGGIGSGICEVFAGEGANVAVWDMNGDGAAAIAGAVPNARPYQIDITDSAAVDEMVDRVLADFGRVDVLINNAGIIRVGDRTDELSDEVWSQSIGVMQTAVFYCSRAVGRKLIAQGSGAVVNIASIRGFQGHPGRLAYCAAKAAVIMMTQVMGAEWGPLGVRVNAVAPGFVATANWTKEVERGFYKEEQYLNAIPAGRLATPREIGQLCSYLSSDECPYIMGSCVTIDGALTGVPSG